MVWNWAVEIKPVPRKIRVTRLPFTKFGTKMEPPLRASRLRESDDGVSCKSLRSTTLLVPSARTAIWPSRAIRRFSSTRPPLSART